MKKQTATLFDDLMKNYYGVAGSPELSNTAKVEALLTDYYGRPYKRKRTCESPAVSLSLSQDNGEVLAQTTREDQFEEYVVQKSASVEAFEEYVVDGSRHFSERAIAASLNIGPVEAANPTQECQVDVLEPLRNEGAPAGRTFPPAPNNTPYQRAAQSAASQQSSASYVAQPDETSRAKASEDDFISDMKSILSGQAVFDPATGRTVDKESFARGPARDQSNSNDKTFPEADKAQAIFDRIAQSMQYANAYDLGTVELENRFADFDRISDLQQKAKETKKTKEAKSAKDSAAAAKVDSEDFIRDLDAIRTARTGSTNGVERSESLSAAIFTAPAKDSEPDTGCIPFALSLSTFDNPGDYSRPLYDTGEHVLTGWDLYTEQLRVGKAPGVMFSYGQLIAMPDLFESVDQMMNADVNELKTLKALIELDATYYRGKMKGRPDSSMSVSNKRWQESTHERFLDLAEKNYKHFSPSPVFKALPRIATTQGDNKSAWEWHHRTAIQEAQRMFLAPENANRSVFLEYPLIINAFGDHFLTDAFASGHLINKEATIEYFKSAFFSGHSLNSDAQTFFEKVAEKAFKGAVKEKFSKLETSDWRGFPGVHPDINSTSRFASLLSSIAEQEPDQIGNLAVKALHDRLNKDGVDVTNNAGSGTWRLFGDGMMNDKSLGIIRKAVQQSVDNINDPSIRASNLNFDTYFAKVWKYVPQLTPSSLQRVESLTVEYTNPKSSALIDAAAQLVSEEVDLLIKKLLKADALRSNNEGWLPNLI